MRLYDGWEAERASGWWELHHLRHTPCGWRTGGALDLIKPDQQAQARQIMNWHACADPGVWVAKHTEEVLWTVGYYDTGGTWHTDSDHPTPEDAQQRADELNAPDGA